MDGPDERRIVLLGKTGSGKSSLGNTILGGSLLKAKVSPQSETSWCKAESKIVNGKRTTVIDTPGFCDTNMSEEEQKREIVECLVECAPGPHAFLIVLEVRRYTDQEKEVINKIREYFPEETLKHAVIVFTHGDQLDDNMKIEEFVSKSKALRDLVKKCGDRCHVFDNKHWNDKSPGDYRSNQYQKKQLIDTIDEMKKSRGYYTNKTLQVVQKEKKENPNGIVERLLRIFVGVTAGALIGALFGAPIKGACLGYDVAQKTSTAYETVAEIWERAPQQLKLEPEQKSNKKDE